MHAGLDTLLPYELLVLSRVHKGGEYLTLHAGLDTLLPYELLIIP